MLAHQGDAREGIPEPRLQRAAVVREDPVQPVVRFRVILTTGWGGDALLDGAALVGFVLDFQERAARVGVFPAAHLITVWPLVDVQVIQGKIGRIEIQGAVMVETLPVDRQDR